MSSTGTRRRRRGQHETPNPTPTPPLVIEQGATLTLRNPDVLRGEWDAEARKSETVAAQDREAIVQLLKEADEHKGQAGSAADEEMRLMQALAEAKRLREFHDGQKEAKLAEAQQITGRAQFHEDRAADLRAAMNSLPPAGGAGVRPEPESDQGETDPAGPTRVDLGDAARMDASLAKIDAAHAELPAKHRDEELAL